MHSLYVIRWRTGSQCSVSNCDSNDRLSRLTGARTLLSRCQSFVAPSARLVGPPSLHCQYALAASSFSLRTSPTSTCRPPAQSSTRCRDTCLDQHSIIAVTTTAIQQPQKLLLLLLLLIIIIIRRLCVLRSVTSKLTQNVEQSVYLISLYFCSRN